MVAPRTGSGQPPGDQRAISHTASPEASSARISKQAPKLVSQGLSEYTFSKDLKLALLNAYMFRAF